MPRRESSADQGALVDRCLSAFVQAGMLDLSLDRLADQVGVSKRMLIHYFGGRENIEELAMTRLEDRLRAQFAPDSFPSGITPKAVISSLWDQTTAPESKGVLLLVMDLSRRAWKGSARAQAFYAEQQRLWAQLLLRFLPDRNAVEEILQCFQGAVLAYLITGDREPGKRSLLRLLSRDSTRNRMEAKPKPKAKSS